MYDWKATVYADMQSSLRTDERSFLPTVLKMAVIVESSVAFLYISVEEIGTQSMHGKSVKSPSCLYSPIDQTLINNIRTTNASISHFM